VHSRNSGRDNYPLLLKRGKILKDESNPYHWKDLFVGGSVSIYSRSLFIIDADPSTRRFYDGQNLPLAEPIKLAEDELPRY
jgi:hypothetical protein